MVSNALYSLEILMSSTSDTPSSSDKLYNIPFDSVMKLEVTESVITLLPKIEIVIADKGTFLDINPIVDKDVLHIRFNTNLGEPETEIHTKFIISGITILSDRSENQGNHIRLVGYMAADHIFTPLVYNAMNGSSDDIIGKVVKNSGLKFTKDVSGTESVYWYQSGNNYKYITYIAERAYVPNDGVFVYGTLDGTINYTSFKTRYSKESKLDAVYDRERTQNNALITDKDKATMFYDGYSVLDLSEQFNNFNNYGGIYNRYDTDKYAHKEIYSISDNTELKNKNKSYNEEISFYDYIGIVAEKSLQDTIYLGKMQNEFTKFQLFSNTISVNANNATRVSLFDKIDLNIQSPLDSFTMANPYSGDYMVASISYSLVKDSGFAKRVLLCRAGVNKSTFRKNYEEVE